jgi:hypothetical protein
MPDTTPTPVRLDVESIPETLRNISQWVCWRGEDRNGKRTKLPVNPHTGGNAVTTNPQTWTSFDEAVEFAAKRHNVDGVGFVFTKDAGIIGIDLDHCVNKQTGEIVEWAQQIVNSLDSYTEYSPSGDGLHIYIRASALDGMKNKKKMPDGSAIEIYDHARYFTVTGRHVAGTPTGVEERQEQLEAAYKQHFGDTCQELSIRGNAKTDPTEMGVEEMDRRLQKALAEDPSFKKLWNGNTSGYNNDDSAADLALCNKLVRYFGRDEKLIDEVFRLSELMREKWERDDYRRLTIIKALGGGGNDTDGKKKSGGGRSGPSLRDIVAVLEGFPEFQHFWYDDFLQRGLTKDRPEDPPREWRDHDDLETAVKLQGLYGFSKAAVETIRQAIATEMGRRRKNCVRDWMESLQWGGTPRIDTFLIRYFGADDTAYTRAAGKNFWIALVARIYKPGCQVDNMLVLDGTQGIGKSKALRIIGGEWFAEQHESAMSKDFYQNLQGKMLVEISEMDAFQRAEVTRVKQVVTCTSDRYRDSYGRRAEDHPRQCVFVGTSNKWSHDDDTGARRFWPVDCRGAVDVEALAADRLQLFAEAVARFKAGETWWEMPVEETLAQQKGRFNTPALAEPIQRYINNERIQVCDGSVDWQPRSEPLTRMTMGELLIALDIPKAQWKSVEKDAAKALRSLEWDNKPYKEKGETIRGWRPKPKAAGAETP